MRKHSKEYTSYMKSDAWAQKREERLQLDDNKCVLCGRKNGLRKDDVPILQVHHVHYGNLGNEPLADLCSVCPRCHQLLHRYYRRFRSWEDRKADNQGLNRSYNKSEIFENIFLFFYFFLLTKMVKCGMIELCIGGILCMVKLSELNKQLYKVGEVANILGVTPKTISNYADDNKLEVIRTDGGHRMISKESFANYLNNHGLLEDDINRSKVDVVYARVSSHEQKTKGDLDRQVVRIIEAVQNMQNPLILKEVGSGLNDNRKLLIKLIHLVISGKVHKVYVTYRDRLTRFGFNYLETVFNDFGVEIVVLGGADRDKDAQNEFCEDLMSLVASFSGKLYGMRSHKNKKAKGK